MAKRRKKNDYNKKIKYNYDIVDHREPLLTRDTRMYDLYHNLTKSEQKNIKIYDTKARYKTPIKTILNHYKRRFNKYEDIKNKINYLPNRFMALPSYVDPRKAIICLGRKIRREVLFANKRVGKGHKVSDKRIFNEDSKVRC